MPAAGWAGPLADGAVGDAQAVSRAARPAAASMRWDRENSIMKRLLK